MLVLVRRAVSNIRVKRTRHRPTAGALRRRHDPTRGDHHPDGAVRGGRGDAPTLRARPRQVRHRHHTHPSCGSRLQYLRDMLRIFGAVSSVVVVECRLQSCAHATRFTSMCRTHARVERPPALHWRCSGLLFSCFHSLETGTLFIFPVPHSLAPSLRGGPQCGVTFSTKSRGWSCADVTSTRVAAVRTKDAICTALFIAIKYR